MVKIPNDPHRYRGLGMDNPNQCWYTRVKLMISGLRGKQFKTGLSEFPRATLILTTIIPICQRKRRLDAAGRWNMLLSLSFASCLHNQSYPLYLYSTTQLLKPIIFISLIFCTNFSYSFDIQWMWTVFFSHLI